MVELSAVLHEISVAFGCSNNLKTLTPRLADALARHLQVAEVETVRLIPRQSEVGICAYAPGICRRWEGRRSARFLERQGVVAPTFVTDELARVAIAPIEAKLKIPVGRVGLLSIAFETDISVMLGSRENTEIFVDSLALHCLRLGQLLATAMRCWEGQHRLVGTEKSVASEPDAHRKHGTEIPVIQERIAHTPPSPAPRITDMSVREQATDMTVETIDSALVRCICTALDQTRGKIYGPGGAAELLGLKPSTLQSKMRKLGIERTQFAH